LDRQIEKQKNIENRQEFGWTPNNKAKYPKTQQIKMNSHFGRP
jgi:hypothetical protein